MNAPTLARFGTLQNAPTFARSLTFGGTEAAATVLIAPTWAHSLTFGGTEAAATILIAPPLFTYSSTWQTVVPTFSPIAARLMLPATSMLNTTIGKSLSIDSEIAVESRTRKPRSNTSKYES